MSTRKEEEGAWKKEKTGVACRLRVAASRNAVPATRRRPWSLVAGKPCMSHSYVACRTLVRIVAIARARVCRAEIDEASARARVPRLGKVWLASAEGVAIHKVVALARQPCLVVQRRRILCA